MWFDLRRLAALLAAAALATGCLAPRVSRVERNWGTALQDSFDSMVANPEGSPPDHDPGVGTDGATVDLAMAALRSGQKPTGVGAQAPTINIGAIGGGTP